MEVRRRGRRDDRILTPSWLAPTTCAGCGTEDVGRLCDDCVPEHIARPAPPSDMLQGCFALASFDSPIANALKAAKYGRQRDLMVELAQVCADRFTPAVGSDSFDALVPVPSPWTRRLLRGFAPSSVLAEVVSQQTGIPVVHALTMRRGAMLAGLGRPERLRALSGRVRSRHSVAGRILLIDDVATTGSTAEACCRELLGDATESVWLLALCVRRPTP